MKLYTSKKTMNKEVRECLIELVRKRTNQTVTYQKLSDDCNLKLNMTYNPYDRVIIGQIIWDISRFEHSQKRLLLSSLVIRKCIRSTLFMKYRDKPPHKNSGAV